MMSKNQINEREQLEILTIDQLVPQDHLVRKLEAAIDFSFIYPLVENLYSSLGRPSIDPVVLFKMTFIQYVFGIRSMRQTIKEIETNMAYRWFLGFGFHTEVPHFSTFGKNYARRFQDTDVFEQIFYRILKEIMKKGLLHADHVFIDSTHVKASANKRKYDKKVVRKETRAYEEKLQLELNIDREEHGKKPFPPERFEKDEWKEIKESTTDPESGYYVKDERTKQFAYSFHAATDEKGFVLGTIVTPGNVHDSYVLQPLVEKIIKKVKKPLAIAADAAYKTPAITNFLLENQMLPVLPYTRPKTKDGFFRKHEYVYDEYYNCYLCPQGQVLKYTTTTKEGYRQYKSNPTICANCPLLSQCTESKNHQKLIQRHIWETYMEEAEHLRHSYAIKQIYAKRKETIERVFADAKEKHGMRWTTLRGLKKLSMQAMLTFAAMNLKKLATWTWQAA
ncbi:transposase [Lysinibacillus sphaericus]|uniref:Transposase n=3 Tax=Lysinibacillus sphaericus TaxID=1421 RepID=A0A2S0K2L6_LYSSH|nr:IS1182 family transposase [Lysinibacillus sphaericus]AVK96640.1 IS5/IS1182 family transposase [Lysinibacillus sphaericus]AVK97613.1 IS5/IS1182 family transposase [Lysinibacillus sphaericus]SUV16470.1 transposase [Lysinibacillus sphaericus]SUV17562.1 transposase [Lysinibacillus sphaericus]